MKTTKEQTQAAIGATLALAAAIRDLGQVNSGTMYALLCGAMDLGQFNALITILKNAGVVRESGHMLFWIGPVSATVNSATA